MVIRGPSKYSCDDVSSAKSHSNDNNRGMSQKGGAVNVDEAIGDVFLSLKRCQFCADFYTALKFSGINLRIVDIDVQDAAPQWLPGVPTVIDADGDGFCGDAAFQWLQSKIAEPPSPAPAHFPSPNSQQADRVPQGNRTDSSTVPFLSANDRSLGTSIEEAYSTSAQNSTAISGRDAMCISETSDRIEDTYSRLMEGRKLD
jgi:hypothetical protein